MSRSGNRGPSGGETVSLDTQGIIIRGKHTDVVCASLFYFRVPEGLWRDRMRKVHAAGYNAIDVYFPWNFHEREKDRWDFSSPMRDIETFLRLAADEGLYVVARPGPYICSEWDGGGLPAYLFADGVAIRQNDAAYLARVREWYRRILPMIARCELGAGGSVILLQIENELDFFDCRDVPGYLSALGDMAREYAVRVPLFACAGQGDLWGAWGETAGVAPAMNLYLDPRQPGLEAGLREYVTALTERGFPLMVTETGRDVLLLRRLLAAGAKLVGPYNQVGGYDFGFTAGTNNWGEPLSLQTTYYDFSSLITPFGEIRPGVWEDWALSGLLSALGPALARAMPVWEHDIRIEARGDLCSGEAPALRIAQEGAPGYLVPLTNTGTVPVEVRFTYGGRAWPEATTLTVAPGTSRFVLFDVSLVEAGIPGKIRFSSAEPVFILPSSSGKPGSLVLRADGGGEVCLDLGAGEQLFSFRGDSVAEQSITAGDGRPIHLYGISLSTPDLTRLSRVPGLRLPETSPSAPAPVARRGGRSLPCALTETTEEELFRPAERAPAPETAMEKNGHLRGFGRYTASFAAESPTQGLLLHGASDVLSVSLDGRYLGTQVPAGSDAYFDFGPDRPVAGASKLLSVRCEIWGHSNFDDPRKPATRIASLKGFHAATLVTHRQPLPVWRVLPEREEGGGLPYFGPLGGRLTTRVPPGVRYETTLRLPQGCSRALLRFAGVECPCAVEIDGKPVGQVDRFYPMVDLTGRASPGSSARIVVIPASRYYTERCGTAELLAGSPLDGWALAGVQERELGSSAATGRARSGTCTLPLHLPRGSLAWLYASLGETPLATCHSLEIRGKDLKATVLWGDNVVGRLFLPAACRPRMAGGSETLAYLPACWSAASGSELRILLEAVGEGEGILEGMEVAAIG